MTTSDPWMMKRDTIDRDLLQCLLQEVSMPLPEVTTIIIETTTVTDQACEMFIPTEELLTPTTQCTIKGCLREKDLMKKMTQETMTTDPVIVIMGEVHLNKDNPHTVITTAKTTPKMETITTTTTATTTTL